MSERKFECHMTFHVDNAPWVKAAGEANGFKYSQIDGDAKMGPKPWCYLTAYAPTGEALKERMWEVEVLLEAAGVATLRKKIEEIVYDTKTGVDNLRAAAS